MPGDRRKFHGHYAGLCNFFYFYSKLTNMKFLGRDINIRDKKYKYKATVFLICLAFSALIWLLIKLSGEYTTTLVYPVSYKNIPEGKLLTNKVDTTVTVGLHDKGFTLAYLKYFTARKPLEVDLSALRLKPENDGYEAAAGTAKWARQMLTDHEAGDNLEYVNPDTLYFFFEDKVSKKVPVMSDVTLQFKKQYFAYDSLKITPDEVEVSGSQSRIANIHFIKTAAITLSDLSSNVSRMVPLEKPKNAPHVKIDPDQVQIDLAVEKFTEADIEVPVKKINQPAHLRVKLFPEKVHILYLVALKDFNKVNPDMFSVTVDLSGVTKDEDKKLKVRLQSQPKFVKINRIEPPEIEFLLLK